MEPTKILIPKYVLNDTAAPMKVLKPVRKKIPVLQAQDYSSQEKWMAKSQVLSYIDSRKAIADEEGLMAVNDHYNQRTVEWLNAYNGGIPEMDTLLNKLCGAYTQNKKELAKNYVVSIAKLADYAVTAAKDNKTNAS